MSPSSTGLHSPEPTTARVPQGEEEWNLFLTRYALGEYSACNFADEPHDTTGDDDQPSTLPGSPPGSPTLGPNSTTMSRRTSVQLAQPTPLSPLLPLPPLPQTSESEESDREPASKSTARQDTHPNVSASGPSNQDPSIPNMPESSKTARTTTTRRKASAEVEGSGGQGMLSKANMEQLATDQRHDEATTAMKEEAAGEPRARKKRTARRDRAELASAGTISASSDSDQDRLSQRRTARRSAPRPRSVRSRHSRTSIPSVRDHPTPVDEVLLESGSNATSSVSHFEIDIDPSAERKRLRDFYETNGYMPAPRQTPDATRRRLRVIRRLGIETPEEIHKVTLDRFTRLAVSIFKTKMALISIVGRDRQMFLSEIGFGTSWTELDISFCCHTIMGTGDHCLVVPNTNEDWRFRKNPLVLDPQKPIKFYAGAPLKVGTGSKAAIIGSLCVLDDQPRQFDEHSKRLLQDLADCVVSELELLYNQQASVDSAKLHQISVDFLRRSLKTRPTERAGASRTSGTSTTSSSGKKRKEGADQYVSDHDVDIYDEACSEIRLALDAYAVAVVDLSQFHLFYPAYQNSSTTGSSTRNTSSRQDSRASSTRFPSRPGTASSNTVTTSASYSDQQATTYSSASTGPHVPNSDEAEAYSKPANRKHARQTFAMSDPTAPSRTPQVLFVPARRKTDAKTAKLMGLLESETDADELAVLGYSCANDGFAFNFASSPAARKIISDFIASNVKTRRVWYTRDDSAGIAQSITHLMPPGTETSMAMPVFGFDGQVAFAVVACWTDPLYTYPAGAIQFVETIAGSLLASVMKERLHQAERAQLNFAAAASHELRTPLHQINAAATLLRVCLDPALTSPAVSPPVSTDMASPRSPQSPRQPGSPSSSKVLASEDRIEALAHLEIIESNGLALGNILENIIDTLDIGRMSGRMDEAVALLDGQMPAGAIPGANEQRWTDLAQVLEKVVESAIESEIKTRKIAGLDGLENVEMILEMLPRNRGGWLMTNDSGPVARALSKIIHNACKFTHRGFIHITVQDVSRDVVLPAGYDNSIRLSTISIDIKDSGCGMSGEFLEREVLRPFAKADPFMPGSGLGLGLAQRMIEILGGKLAIASTLNKGTLVHVELPLHLLNEDNESDQDDLQPVDPTTLLGSHGDNDGSRMMVRQDGIYLAGFDVKHPGVRRVGKSLLRQLKLNSCRVVTDLHYANLIVIPDCNIQASQLAELARSARPSVEVIILAKSGVDRPLPSPDQALSEVSITYLYRPLRPSVMAVIMKPPELQPQVPETYISPVVGGPPTARSSSTASSTTVTRPQMGSRGTSMLSMASASSGAARQYPRSLDTITADLIPSPPESPGDTTSLTEHTGLNVLSEMRPALAVQHAATDPLPLSHFSDTDSSQASSEDTSSNLTRPSLREAASGPVIEGDHNEGAMRVLVVEDNAVNRRILTTMLKRTACRFAEAIDGEDAVQQFKAFRPSLVLLDINMPVKDGFAAAAEMRHIESKLKWQRSRIIAVTALSGEAQKRRGFIECGIDEWRTKPVGIKSLREAVERWKAA
ncbi:hypothetical protein BCR39DRAFT_525320 [Naematelia encephala]|uniref:histidine kinase n=1 Tax=Naematelia encephala TaxID=71784 RepID=A0A1Y2BAD7_9TREE|nr:hypothetical protein BCR39DRAFT_525320 [Naematelia encephala]